MANLYLSDLDGTLLRSNERLSDYTIQIINRFVRDGGYFSCATARSFLSATRAITGLNLQIPMICHNGAFIFEHANNTAQKTLVANFIDSSAIEFIMNLLGAKKIYPIVFAQIDGRERFSFIERYVNHAIQFFLDNRIGDPRRREVNTISELYAGDIYEITCMADTAISVKATESAEDSFFAIDRLIRADARLTSIIEKDIYSGAQWCEILSVKATKANAALQLKNILGCGKLVVFGDNRNDLSMFSVADECYAVANAVPELKEIATAVIGANDNDGVAKWILENA